MVVATNPAPDTQGARRSTPRSPCTGRTQPSAEPGRLRSAPPRLPVVAQSARSARCPLSTTSIDPVDEAPAVPAPPAAHVRRHLQHGRALLGLAILAIAAATTIEFWPAIVDATGDSLDRLNPLWVLPALALVSVSMLSAALLQHRVLRAGGLVVPLRSMIAIAVASNAVSVTLPIAGSSAGTAFTYLQLKKRGADLPLAGWTIAVSGIISTSVLAVLLGVGASLSDDTATSALGAAAVLAGIIPMAALLAVLRWPRFRARTENATVWALRHLAFHSARARQIDPTAVSAAFDRIAGFRLGRRAALSSALMAAVNWTTDVAVLAICVTAFGGSIPWTHLAVIYGAALGAASLSFTPAGIGIVESAVAVTLIQFGTPTHLAVIAAILYRALSCWLVLALGWASYVVLRRRTDRVPTDQPATNTALLG